MANNWKIVRFEEIKAESKNAFSMGPFGSKIKAENFKLQGVPVLKGGNLSGIFINEDSFDYLDENKASELKASTAVRGDIVITHRGTLGQVGIIPHSSKYEKYIASQSQLKLSFNRELVDPNFIYYFLKSPEGQSKLLANKSQVGVPAIAQALTSVKSIEINLPSLVEQKRIADFLINIDYFLLNLMESNQILEMLARTIFKSWFVNFDPVHAKAAGQEPEGLSAGIAALFPSEFEESELGLIPKGWEIQSLDKNIDYLNGLALQKFPALGIGTDLPVLKIAQLRAGKTDPLIMANVSSKPAYIIRDGDVVFSWSGTLEVKLWTGGDCALNQHLFKVSSSTLPKWFCYLATLSHLDNFRAIAESKQTTMGHIQRGHLTEAKIILPPTESLNAFSSVMSPIIDTVINNSVLTRTLSNIRDELLPRLISGKIQIEEAEEALAEVMPSTEKQVA